MKVIRSYSNPTCYPETHFICASRSCPSLLPCLLTLHRGLSLLKVKWNRKRLRADPHPTPVLPSPVLAALLVLGKLQTQRKLRSHNMYVLSTQALQTQLVIKLPMGILIFKDSIRAWRNFPPLLVKKEAFLQGNLQSSLVRAQNVMVAKYECLISDDTWLLLLRSDSETSTMRSHLVPK